jgi:hypothetical protein
MVGMFIPLLHAEPMQEAFVTHGTHNGLKSEHPVFYVALVPEPRRFYRVSLINPACKYEYDVIESPDTEVVVPYDSIRIGIGSS